MSSFPKYASLADNLSRLESEYVRSGCRLPLVVLVEHAEKSIVSGRFTAVVPFLSVTGYLIGVVQLKSQERIDNLGYAK
jgi:hypothetical protein